MLYVARRLNWQNDKRALAVADPSEASELATLFPHAQRRSIASGKGVVVAGAGFVQATDTAEIQLSGCEISFDRAHEPEFWISTATQNVFADLQTRLVDEARVVFDDELGEAARRGRHLSKRGNAALLLLRRCGPLRHEDLAIRQLAGARQNRELDLYRRLLIRFEIELDAEQDDLHRKVGKHIELAAAPLQHKVVGRTLMDITPKLGEIRERRYSLFVSMLAIKAESAKIQTRMFDQTASKTGRQSYILRSIHRRGGSKFSKLQKINNFGENIQPTIQQLPKRLEPKDALLVRFLSEATETSGRKPTIGFLSFRVATLPFSKKGVVGTEEYREAL